jgi:hypothetical protein
MVLVYLRLIGTCFSLLIQLPHDGVLGHIPITPLSGPAKSLLPGVNVVFKVIYGNRHICNTMPPNVKDALATTQASTLLVL